MNNTLIITGGAGFIGSHVVRLFVNKYPEYRIINLDKLTYAGNLANLKDIEDKPNYKFVKMDICDFEGVLKLMQEEHVNGIIHLAAESHVDRSIKDPFTFAQTNVMGTLSLLQAAKTYWESLPERYEGKRFYHISTDEVYGALQMTHPEGIPAPFTTKASAAPVRDGSPVTSSAITVHDGFPVTSSAAPVRDGFPVTSSAVTVRDGFPVTSSASPVRDGSPVPSSAAPVRDGSPVTSSAVTVRDGFPVTSSAAPVRDGFPVTSHPAYGDTFFTEDLKYQPHSPYSASKASSDHFVRAYHDTYGMPTIVTNCSNNYGPYQFPEKLIPLFINNIRHRKSLPVYGRGENVRDWLYVEDHARAIDTIFHRGKIAETYNIGGFNEWKNIDIIKVLIQTVDKALGRVKLETSETGETIETYPDMDLITYVTDRAGHDLRYAIDSRKLQRELGWEPSLQFEEGIEKTVKWYLDNQEWLDNITSGDYQTYYETMYANRSTSVV